MAPEIHAELRLHADVQTLEDEWSGITDPVIRRKLQNRLNQRAARRRKAAQKNAGKDAAAAHSPASNSSGSGSEPRTAAARDIPLHKRIDLKDLLALKAKSLAGRGKGNVALEPFSCSANSAFVSIRSKNSCQWWYEVLLENRLVEIKEVAVKLQNDRDNAWMYPLPSDHLISLVYYNVYRALITNVETLGLDLNLMYTDDYPSPFLPLSPTATSNIRRLPPTLEPTELQRTVAHHPQWDIFPYAELRDGILRYGEDNINDQDLCLDMVGSGCYDQPAQEVLVQNQNGLIVWGEPWDDNGWEVTETFARKWHFLVRGAAKLQQSTNRWRAQRDEEPLDFEKILEIA